MIKVNAVKLNNYYNPKRNLSFRGQSTNNTTQGTTPDVAILSMQDQNATTVNFKKNIKPVQLVEKELANPIKALANQIRKAIKSFFETNNNGYDLGNDLTVRWALL